MFTQRAVLLGFVALCLYLVAVVNSLPGYFSVLVWLAVGLLVASFGLALLAPTALTVEARVARTRGVARWNSRPSLEDEMNNGAAPLLELSIRNRGSIGKVGLSIELLLRSADSVESAEIGSKRKGGERAALALPYLVEALPGGQTVQLELPLNTLVRGVYHIVEARIIGSDVLGLFRARRRLKWDELPPLYVAPPMLPDVSTSISSGGRTLQGARRARVAMGDEMRGLRPYAAGDDLRHVHWNSTARTGELIVREWEQTGRARVAIVWDGSPDPNGRGDDGPLAAPELGLCFCASLALGLLESGAPVSLVLSGESLERAEATSLPGRGALPTAFHDLLAGACVAATRRNLSETVSELPIDCDVVVLVTPHRDAARAITSRRVPTITVWSGAPASDSDSFPTPNDASNGDTNNGVAPTSIVRLYSASRADVPRAVREALEDLQGVRG